MSPPERILWPRLKLKQLDGLRFRRQHPLGEYVADFYCHEAGLVVEIDSKSHDGRLGRDAARDAWMRARGLEVLRVRASDVVTNLDGVLLTIRERARDRIAAIRSEEEEEKR